MLTFTVISETSPGSTGTPITADGLISICSNETTVDLFDQLDGEDLGGTWTGPGDFTSTDGIVPIADLIVGDYTYTIGDGLSCSTIESTTITIEIVEFVSFESTIAMSFCKFENSVDLATLLDPTIPTTGVYTEDASNSILGVLTCLLYTSPSPRD